MKYLAAAVVLVSAIAGAAHADEANASVKKAVPVRQGVVTVEFLQTVVVEAKRWSSADEAAFQKARANTAAANSPLADKISRGPEYAMH
jgi:hypothetical protein